MCLRYLSIVLVLFLCRWTQAVITVNFDGEFKSCSNGMDLLGWDLTNLDVLQMDNENTTLNGNVTFTRDYNNPMSVKITLRRFDKLVGNWILAATRIHPNFCDEINAKGTMWATVVQHLKQQQCPFVTGHTEHFDHANIGNLAKNLKIPDQLLGPWRLFMELGSVREGSMQTECTMIDLMLVDV